MSYDVRPVLPSSGDNFPINLAVLYLLRPIVSIAVLQQALLALGKGVPRGQDRPRAGGGRLRGRGHEPATSADGLQPDVDDAQRVDVHRQPEPQPPPPQQQQQPQRQRQQRDAVSCRRRRQRRAVRLKTFFRLKLDVKTNNVDENNRQKTLCADSKKRKKRNFLRFFFTGMKLETTSCKKNFVLKCC